MFLGLLQVQRAGGRGTSGIPIAMLYTLSCKKMAERRTLDEGFEEYDVRHGFQMLSAIAQRPFLAAESYRAQKPLHLHLWQS